MSTVTVVIYWREKGRSEWKHTVEPEVATAMQEALANNDEWLIWETSSRQRMSSGYYNNYHAVHRVRSEEILGMSVHETERERSRY